MFYYLYHEGYQIQERDFIFTERIKTDHSTVLGWSSLEPGLLDILSSTKLFLSTYYLEVSRGSRWENSS